MRPMNHAPGSYAPQKMEGLIDDLWTGAKDIVSGVNVGDVKLTDVLPSASEVASATKTAATARLQQSINKALGTTQPASGTPKPTATVPTTLPAVQPGLWERTTAWVQAHPLEATVIAGVTVWVIKQALKKRR